MAKLLIAAAYVLLASGAPVLAQDIDRGKKLADDNCARCHAIGLAGTSPRDLAPAFRDLTQRYPVDTLWEALAEGIVTGHPDMPEFIFPLKDIDDILGYITSIQPQ